MFTVAAGGHRRPVDRRQRSVGGDRIRSELSPASATDHALKGIRELKGQRREPVHGQHDGDVGVQRSRRQELRHLDPHHVDLAGGRLGLEEEDQRVEFGVGEPSRELGRAHGHAPETGNVDHDPVVGLAGSRRG